MKLATVLPLITICGMKVMAMLLSKFILLSRYYANILNSEVIQANYIILNFNTLFSDIVFIIDPHDASLMVTLLVVKHDACHILWNVVMATLIQKYKLPSTYHLNILKPKIFLTKHVFSKFMSLFIVWVYSIYKNEAPNMAPRLCWSL